MTGPNKLGAVVMAAGLGTRMKSALPKHLHPILGRRMVDWVLAAAQELQLARVAVVASQTTADLFPGLDVVVQERPLGTVDAVRSARKLLEGKVDEILVLSGDTPLLTSALLGKLVETHRQEKAAATVLSFCPEDVRSYGRVLRDEKGGVSAIVEAGDASPEELAVREVNSSIYVFQADKLWPALEQLKPANAQGELYLTDVIRFLVSQGDRVSACIAEDPVETEGVNTRAEMAAAAAILRDRINGAHMLAGVCIVDPGSTWIEPGVELEPDSTIHPFSTLRGRTRVRSGAEIGPQVVAIDAEIGENVSVGPFCYLRPGTVLEAGAKAGTFVEIKNSQIGEGAKVPHLSYIGDSDVGAGANVAAGAITANYRPELGPGKQRTKIGRNVRTGVHTSFVPPVEVGDGAVIAAGSVITDDVPPGALAIARARQLNKEDYASEPDGD
jgi:bifunctional UDP-N-acetylglucosamine pyrophosphorylase/glucosamine-1-phosphate N-acetyltransferase